MCQLVIGHKFSLSTIGITVNVHKENTNAKVNHIIEFKDHLFPYTVPIYLGELEWDVV